MEVDIYVNFNVSQLNSLGYQLLALKKAKEAIIIFRLNTEMFPDDANAFDSLGDAYVADKDTVNGIKAYEKAVSKGLSASQPKIKALEKNQ